MTDRGAPPTVDTKYEFVQSVGSRETRLAIPTAIYFSENLFAQPSCLKAGACRSLLVKVNAARLRLLIIRGPIRLDALVEPQRILGVVLFLVTDVRLSRHPDLMSLLIIVAKRTWSSLRTVLNFKPSPLLSLMYCTVASAAISPSSTRK
jgi:hypothetical protein